MDQEAAVAELQVPIELVARRIYLLRGQRVMLDGDLAELYRVPTKALNQQVRRNAERFPEDFMFQLTAEEASGLRSQIVTLDLEVEEEETGPGRGRYAKYAPLAFTELGVAMLSSVLRSDRAVQMNIGIMRAFVKLRQYLATNKVLAQRMEQLAGTVKDHAALFDIVIKDIQSLDQKFTREIVRMKAPRRRKAQIGFLAPEAKT